jgi:phage gp36-like protein
MYCTAEQIVLLMEPAKLGEGLMPDEDTVEDMIRRKSELIDGYCRDRYAVPFASVPVIVEEICLALCLADLVPMVFQRNEQRVAEAQSKARWAQMQLDRIQQNRLSLADGDGAQQGMGGQVLASPPATDPLFSLDQRWS